MEDKYLVLYKNHSIKTVSEKKIYDTIEEDKSDIWNILVPIQSDTIEYIAVKPKKFIPKFKCITFDYYLTVHIYGDANIFFDLDGDNHIYQRVDDDKKTMIKCYTPMEFYSTMYSIYRIQTFNNLFSYDYEIYDFFEITFDDMIIDFEMRDKEYIYKSSNFTKESEGADFEGEISRLVNSISKFVGTTILRNKKNVFGLNSGNECIFVNNDSTWGKGRYSDKSLEYIEDIESPFEIIQIKDITNDNVNYLQSIHNGKLLFRSYNFVYPEDKALLQLIDETNISFIFFSYKEPEELWPLGLTVTPDTIYENDGLADITYDYSGHLYSSDDIIAVVSNSVTIYRSLNIIRNVLYNGICDDVLFGITLYPRGNHSDSFEYTIYSKNSDKIKDTYNDFFKKLRRFLKAKGYLK